MACFFTRIYFPFLLCCVVCPFDVRSEVKDGRRCRFLFFAVRLSCVFDDDDEKIEAGEAK